MYKCPLQCVQRTLSNCIIYQMKGKKLKIMQNNVILLKVIIQFVFINLYKKCVNSHV